MTTITRRTGVTAVTPTTRLIGRVVRELREGNGLSQMRLAELANVDTSYISRIEAGSRKPDRAVLKRIAAASGADASRLFIAAGFLPQPVIEQIERGELSISAVHAVLVEGLLAR